MNKCRHCQMMNKKVNTARPELHPVPVKSPWFHLGIDFIGPYSPPSSNGNKYVLTVCDYFTKFVWAKPLPSKEAKNVAQTQVIKTLRYKKSRVRGRDQSDLFCLCRSIWEGESDDLCQCVKCTGWYHISCVISISCFTSSSSWRCPLCL